MALILLSRQHLTISCRYCNFLVSCSKITLSRRSFDRALRSLPVTQHDRIWSAYIAFARDCNVPETAIRVYRRYLQYAAEAREERVDYLMEGKWPLTCFLLSLEAYFSMIRKSCRRGGQRAGPAAGRPRRRIEQGSQPIAAMAHADRSHRAASRGSQVASWPRGKYRPGWSGKNRQNGFFNGSINSTTY